jgi:hypothetical protein
MLGVCDFKFSCSMVVKEVQCCRTDVAPAAPVYCCQAAWGSPGSEGGTGSNVGTYNQLFFRYVEVVFGGLLHIEPAQRSVSCSARF